MGRQADLTNQLLSERLDELEQMYYVVAYAQRSELIAWFNDYYRTLGAKDDELIPVEGYFEEVQ